MPRITAALITLNEERNLPFLLPALSWADEIVVVDGGSVEGTAQLARSHGCKVLVHPFDNYACQRNRAIDLARGDWIFSIDADERPTRALVDEIRHRASTRRYDAFRIPIRSRIFGRTFRYSGTQDDQPIRLFRRTAARWTGDVHEVLHVDGRVGRLRGWLEHQTLPDLAAFLQKMDRYTTLAAQRRVVAGRPPNWPDRWLAPASETLRRLIWKFGLLDGPQGWCFAVLSGLSQWMLAQKHRREWHRSRQSGIVLTSPASKSRAA
jgi:glycosyltransferase involved in cell wall biosynthesis